MRKFLLGVFALLIIAVIAGVIMLPRFVSVDNMKQHVAEQVQKFTGRKLEIKGDVAVAFWPTASVVMEDVHLSNAEWSKHKEMVAVKKLSLELAWMSLLSGEIQINRFVLSEPDIRLEINKNGKANWDFASLGKLTGEYDIADTSGISALDSMKSFKLGEVKIENGILNYSDNKSGINHEMKSLNLALAVRDVNAPIKLVLDTNYKNQPFNIKLQAGALSDLLGKGSTDAILDVSSPVVELGFTGMVKKSTAISADGKISLSSKNLRELAAVFGSKIQAAEGVLKKFSINGQMKFDDKSVSISTALIELDSISGNGEVAVNYGGAIPATRADISFDNLDVTPYTNSGGTKAASIWWISEAYAETPRGWDNTPVDFSWVKALNLAAKIKATHFKSGEFALDNLNAVINSDKGRLSIKLPDIKLYGGEGDINLAIQPNESGATLQTSGDLKAVDVGAALKAMNSDFMTGHGDVQWNLSTNGNSQQRWMENMQGTLAANVKDGTMKGMNMLDMAKNMAASFNPAAQQNAATKFSLVKAAFDGVGGVFKSKELLMEADKLNVTGDGSVMLASQQINFRVTPTVAAAERAKSSSSLTILVDGSWYSPRFRPDMKATIEKALQDPESAKKSLQDLRKNLKGFLGQ